MTSRGWFLYEAVYLMLQKYFITKIKACITWLENIFSTFVIIFYWCCWEAALGSLLLAVQILWELTFFRNMSYVGWWATQTKRLPVQTPFLKYCRAGRRKLWSIWPTYFRWYFCCRVGHRWDQRLLFQSLWVWHFCFWSHGSPFGLRSARMQSGSEF